MSIKGQRHPLILVKGHSDFKVKCLYFGLYTQVSDSGPWALLFGHAPAGKANIGPSMMACGDTNTIKHMYSATFLFIISLLLHLSMLWSFRLFSGIYSTPKNEWRQLETVNVVLKKRTEILISKTIYSSPM